jgi:hypothetical protein
LTREFVECVVDRELPHQSFLIGQAQGREALRHGPQADPFESNLLLAFDIGGTDDQRESF